MIDHIVFDVDGTLTDGGIIISSDGVESKRFNVRDGQIMVMLPQIGFTTIFLTGRNSELTSIRAAELHISVVIQNAHNKAEVLHNFFDINGLTGDQFAYVGDDINDYAAMKLCSFKACPLDAANEIKKLSDYISPNKGGHGAVRDICEHLLHKQNVHGKFIERFT